MVIQGDMNAKIGRMHIRIGDQLLEYFAIL